MEKRQFLKRFGQAAVALPFIPQQLSAQASFGDEPYPDVESDDFLVSNTKKITI